MLYVISTPIGNMEDITIRALNTLKKLDLIAAEDTRVTKKLLTHYGIKVKVVSCFKYNEAQMCDYLIGVLKDGLQVGLVSEAGTPSISDPGYRLVKRSLECGIIVNVIPGPSAVTAALSISGVEADRFVFEGYVAKKSKDREKILKRLKEEERSVVFFESPKRLMRTLEEMRDTIGDREVIVIREMTKVFEETVKGKISEVIKVFLEKGVKGEITVVLPGKQGSEDKDLHPCKEEIAELLKDEKMRVKDVAMIIAERWGLPKRRVYQEVLQLKGKSKS
ncbi:MAG: 16S rRNA (cytidine(1402)-2'-O)-methyltransferase [Spirochaetota bacterium]|nr:16S rRNA (cytidine(1402)-2'-O)-methyltransferase [Spirochaetota bacterium]